MQIRRKGQTQHKAPSALIQQMRRVAVVGCLALVGTFGVSTRLMDDNLRRRGSSEDKYYRARRDNKTLAKPKMILHVGPPKTSSTTLQSHLTELREALMLDNYLYVGRIYDEKGTYEGYEEKPFHFLTSSSCLVDEGLEDIFHEHGHDSTIDWTHDRQAPSCWKAFLVELNRVRRMNMNVIISDEVISLRGYHKPEFHLATLKETLKDWDVRVVATYRRYFEWLPSHKDHRDNYKLISGKEYKKWTGMKTYPLFPQLQECMEDRSKQRYPYIDTVVGNYSQYFPVGVMNMHDVREYKTLASQFVCNFLPDAESTCNQSLRDSDGGSSLKLNTAKSVFYDMLAVAAFHEGMITEKAGSRSSVREKIQHQHEVVLKRKPSDFPLVCPRQEEVEKLLDISIEYEQKFFPEFHNSALGESMHRQRFYDSVHKKRYCTIDTGKTLEQQDWIEFFNRLDSGSRVKKAQKRKRRQVVEVANRKRSV